MYKNHSIPPVAIMNSNLQPGITLSFNFFDDIMGLDTVLEAEQTRAAALLSVTYFSSLPGTTKGA
jgi:hypothetical protein